MEKESDLWETPQWLFERLDRIYKFRFDLCCNDSNCKTKQYVEGDFLTNDISLYTATESARCHFMNPPHNEPYEFVKKASQIARAGATVVCLLKLDTTTNLWRHFVWDFNRQQPRQNVEVLFLDTRLKFELNGLSQKKASFCSVIVVFHRSQENEN